MVLNTFPKVKDTRPDISWGYLPSAFTEKQIELLETLQTRITTVEVYGQFLILEAKCMNDPIEEAENQAAGGGAAMENAPRRLAKAAQTEKTLSANQDSQSTSSKAPDISYPRVDSVSDRALAADLP